MADIQQHEERILKLEREYSELYRSRAGLAVQAGKNRLGQDTEVKGDLTITGILTASTFSVSEMAAHNHQTDAQGGKIDHGAAVSGLLDDDHPQYFNDERHTLLEHTGLGLVANTRSISAGDGLAGGGDLSANRTIYVNPGHGIEILSDAVAVKQSEDFTWTGGHTFQGQLDTRHILPEATDTYDLGSSTKLWRKGWLSELDTVLFAENTMTLLGGWFTVGKGQGAIAADVAAADTTIDFGQTITPGHFVVFRSSLQVEYMTVGTLVSGTTYNVTRDLDGSGANDWVSGSVFLILGTSGDGRIELNAYDTPRIQVLQQGATYNAQTEQIRIGDLNGNWGYSSAKQGMAIGEYAASKANLTLDPTDGLRLRIYDTDYIQLTNDGNALISGKLQLKGTDSALAIGATPPTASNAGTGLWIDRNGIVGLSANDEQIKIDAATGQLTAGGVKLNADGISVPMSTDVPTEDKKLKFTTSGGNTYGEIYGVLGDVPPDYTSLLVVRSISNNANYGAINIVAGNTILNAYASSTLNYLRSNAPFQFPAGSVAAPSLTNSDDTNTGLYFPAADQVGVTCGGIDAVTFGVRGDGNSLVLINTERRWAFQQENTGASTALRLRCIDINKNFFIDTDGYFAFRNSAGTTTKIFMGNGLNIGNYLDPGAGNIYANGNVSAASFTDRTPFFEGDAIAEIKKIRGTKKGIDHDSLPTFAKAIKEDGIIERDLGNMISIQTVAIQQLTERIEKLERKN